MVRADGQKLLRIRPERPLRGQGLRRIVTPLPPGQIEGNSDTGDNVGASSAEEIMLVPACSRWLGNVRLVGVVKVALGATLLASIMIALSAMTGVAASAQNQATAQDLPPGGRASQEAVTYVDEVDDTTVHRLTSDGPNGCLNYMGNMSGEATSWSPDSTRIVYAKRCFGAGGGAGIYVYDLAERRERCISGVGGQWANPIFDAAGVNVYFIDGSDSPRDEQGSKPYAVYRVGAGAPADDGGSCPDRDAVSARVLDIRAAAGVAEDVRVLTRNAAADQADERFATHVRSNGQWRTVVFDRSGHLQPGWGFGDDNPTHDDANDGDASIWSPNDPDKIFTNRATGPGDSRALRGIFQVSEPRLLHVPASCGATNSVAHADWVWHPATGTDIIVGNH